MGSNRVTATQKVATDLKVDASGVAVPVTDNGGSLTVDGTVTATGPLTDAQLRATAVPVSGTVTASGPLTDTQLRATAVPVSLASAPTTAITAAALPLPSGAATAALQGGGMPAALGAGGGVKVDGSGTALPVSGTVTANAGTGTLAVSLATAPALVAGSAVIGATVPQSTPIVANGQVNISNSAATLVAQRTTRSQLTIVNRQVAPIFVGIATVTTANGFQIDPGASLTLYTTALIQAITAAASGASEKVHYVETYT